MTSRTRVGDVFAVPLIPADYGLGVIARDKRNGFFWAYFFGPRLDAEPTLDDARNLRPDKAVCFTSFASDEVDNGE